MSFHVMQSTHTMNPHYWILIEFFTSLCSQARFLLHHHPCLNFRTLKLWGSQLLKILLRNLILTSEEMSSSVLAICLTNKPTVFVKSNTSLIHHVWWSSRIGEPKVTDYFKTPIQKMSTCSPLPLKAHQNQIMNDEWHEWGVNFFWQRLQQSNGTLYQVTDIITQKLCKSNISNLPVGNPKMSNTNYKSI